MGPKAQQYSLLAISRFNVFILVENTAFQKIYILKSQDVIQTATVVVPSPSCHTCYVIIACGTTLWRISLPDEHKDVDDKSNRPFKRRKINEASTDHEDIFADLLGQKEKQSLEDIKSFEPECSTQQNVFSLSLHEKQRLCCLDAEIMDIAVFEEILVALVIDKDIAYIKVFILEGHQTRSIQCFTTGIEATLFCLDPTSNSVKLLHLVEQQYSTYEGGAGRDHNATRTLALPTRLFTLLFGKEAACLRSPVVLLCDTKGCVYFYRIKSLVSQTKRLMVLCEANSEIVCISRVEFDKWPEEKASKNEDAISLLESALCGDHREKRHREALPIIGLLIVSEKGQCFVFLPHEVATEVLVFYLPHSTYSCIVKGNRLFYSTGKSIEVCDLALTKQKSSSIEVLAETKFSLCIERVMHLVSVAKDGIIGVTDELKAINLPVSQDKQGDAAYTDNNMNSLVDSNLKCIQCFSEDTRAAHVLMDSCLLQLNLFASIVKQQRAVSHGGLLKSEETVVMCKCSVSPKPSIPSICLQVQLTNNTSALFTKDWKVDVCVCQKAENVSTGLRHFIFPLPQGLSPKSTKVMYIPISGPSSSNLKPYHLSVSLVLTPDIALKTITKWPGHFQKALTVRIHDEVFDALDYLPLFSCTSGGTDESLCSTLQDSANTFSSELATCLLTLSRTRTYNTLEEELKQNGNTPTFTLAISVPGILCKELGLQMVEDILRLLMTRGKNSEALPFPSSQIQLKTLTNNVPVSLAVSEEPVSKANTGLKDASPEQRVLAYLVTLRSPNLALLMAIRASVKARLEKNHPSQNGSKNKALLSSKVKLNQQLQRYERLADELKVKHSRSFCEENLSEEVNILCGLFDKYELIH